MPCVIHLLEDQGCVRCPSLVASRRRIVHGYGDPAAKVVFIGEAPGGRGADLTGIPFSGDKSGRTLRRMLAALGLADSDEIEDQLHCFLTNAVRCRPPENRTPTLAEADACAVLLDEELNRIEPWLIVPVGRVALRAVGLRYLGHDPGAIRPLHASIIQVGARVIVPLIHPARIARAEIASFLAAMRPLLAERADNPLITRMHANWPKLANIRED
jgi:DNA polymerase